MSRDPSIFPKSREFAKAASGASSPRSRWLAGAIIALALGGGGGLPAADEPTEIGREGREILFRRLDFGTTPMSSDPALTVKRFIIPAPRSLVVTREGQALAENRIAKRISVRLPEVAATADEAAAWVKSFASRFGGGIPLVALREDEVRRHFGNRAWLPLAVSEPLSGEEERRLGSALPEGCFFDHLYLRHYPEGALTAHLLGYNGVSLPDQHGPVAEEEYVGPLVEGRAGMEKALDGIMKGRAGEVLRVCDQQGRILHQEVVREPVPGETLILSINLKMQRLATECLEASGRPGAFVAVDSVSGDVLALVSYPSFDPNVFERGITAAQYAALSEAKEAPLFDRAVSGAYPPGSTFKPFVALAGMSAGAVRGAKTKFAGPGEMLIAGRYFKNWNPHGEGMMDVKYAMLRSCNTWFYQVALDTGAGPITAMSQRFGLGSAPDLPLPSVAAGSIPDPETYNDPRSLANYAIGQGRVLASPVQMALAMAALSNGSQVPRPRLIQGRIDARTEELVERHEAQPAHMLRVRLSDIELIRDGMWGVVNYGTGTAGTARMKTPDVYGKTGTSQWSNHGKKASLAWFVGWVDAFNPRIAFAVVTQGRDGERLSGGGDAAPIAAKFLRTVYAETESYGVTLPDAPSRDDPVITLPDPILAERPPPPQETLPVLDQPVEFDLPPPRRSFFDLLFGRGL
ncbi:MAG: penicillin-binding transpeptidase domain-containing protein [Verrucomicrobiales bacterium]|nr:penicillin-binding transpeptidase domain-containing protein [Verrucomicrobiales bacterium]